jgi:hypothetical protein
MQLFLQTCVTSSWSRGGVILKAKLGNEYHRRQRTPQTKLIHQMVEHVTG